MSLRRHLSRDGIAHANADSDTHQRHVAQRARLKTVEWVPSAVASTGASEFQLEGGDLGLSKGVYYTGCAISERSVSGPEFEAVCAATNWERRWNSATMKRKNKLCTVRRKRENPACEEFVVNLSPWQMTFLNVQLTGWTKAGVGADARRELLLALVEKLRAGLVQKFEAETQRSIIGSYTHLDSNKIHFGIVHSRVGPDNKLVGKKVLPTVGPWSTAQARIAKLALTDAADHRLRENIEKFKRRHGEDVEPLDIALHEALDASFNAVVCGMGLEAVEQFREAKDHYARWKVANRRQSVVRSSTSATVAYETLRLLQPLLPPHVRTAISITRTGVEAFKVVNSFLNAAQPISAISGPSKPQPEKSK